jgi:hypothetical protein
MDALIEALFQAVLSEEDKSDRHRQVKGRILEAEGAMDEAEAQRSGQRTRSL